MSKESPHTYEVIIAGIGSRQFVADSYIVGTKQIYFKLANRTIAQFRDDALLGFIDHDVRFKVIPVDDEEGEK